MESWSTTLTDALEKTHHVMAEQYGFKPKEKVRVELFPDARAFYLASTLSVRDIEVTGAVGLTKFNKLQFLSPRALVHGYRWLDAISHEYMHYLIVKLTSNKAPIWFHEGLSVVRRNPLGETGRPTFPRLTEPCWPKPWPMRN